MFKKGGHTLIYKDAKNEIEFSVCQHFECAKEVTMTFKIS